MRARIIALVVLCGAGVSAASPLGDALGRFEQGEYQAVVNILRPVLDARGRDRAEVAQAYRIYGIACFLTDQKPAAEGAFLKWLELEPRARLDAALVRPEVVDYFNDVRARHRAELVEELDEKRPRTAVLNLFPPVGQFQNGQRVKFGVLLGTEVALLGLNLATGIWLKSKQSDTGTFPDENLAEEVRSVNWVAFGALAVVLVYGLIDGFYYFYHINNEIEIDRDSLRASVSATGNGLSVAY